jgi:hypothetical protein
MNFISCSTGDIELVECGKTLGFLTKADIKTLVEMVRGR